MTDWPATKYSRAADRLRTRTCSVISTAVMDADLSTSTMTSQKLWRKRLWMATRSAALEAGNTFAIWSWMTR